MTSPPSPVLTENLTKRFRHVTALDSLNFRVEPGDVVALLGSNGSGKSTTFRLLLDIYHPTSGRADILGTPSTALKGMHFQRIGYISESQKMPKWMSVERFLEYCSGFYEDWDWDLCQRLVERFTLPPKQKIKHLSRGQAMKVGVTSTLPGNPQLLLLDEPFSGLDVETRAQLSELLKSLAQQEGLAIIITTHDVEEVEPVANRICLLHSGHLVIDERLTDYLDRHRLLIGPDIQLDQLPESIRGSYRKAPALQAESKIFTGEYTPELEQQTLAALAEQAPDAHLVPMNLRQILTARALPIQ